MISNDTQANGLHIDQNLDQNFDGMAERFQQRIYDQRKGQLRLRLVWEDMLRHLPELSTRAPLRIWDAGGGLGQMSIKLAALGHSVLLSDISGDMLAQAAREIATQAADVRARITVQQRSIQELLDDAAQFDVLVCHAVLEWLGEPETTLKSLLARLRPRADISLMFYNINNLIYTNLYKGNLFKVKAENYRGKEGGFTPPQPLSPDDVKTWVQDSGCDIVATRGIRVVHDLLRKDLREHRDIDDILILENRFATREPFASLARYYHMVARKR